MICEAPDEQFRNTKETTVCLLFGPSVAQLPRTRNPVNLPANQAQPNGQLGTIIVQLQGKGVKIVSRSGEEIEIGIENAKPFG